MLVKFALALVLLVAAPANAQPVGGDADNGWFIASGGNERAGACFPCHGTQGQGDDAQAAPRLAGLGEWYLYKQMRNYTNGTREDPIMGPIAEALSEQDWRDIAAFYARLDTALPTPPVVDPDTAERGRLLAEEPLPGTTLPPCAACHGADGLGGGFAVPALAGQGANYMEEQLHRWQTGARHNDPAASMRHITHALTPEDARAVSAYYEALRSEGE